MPRNYYTPKSRITIPEGHIALIIHHQLATELHSLIQQRRRRLGLRMSRLNQAEVTAESSGDINRSVARQDKWQEAKIERDILNDLLLALVDAEVDARSAS